MLLEQYSDAVETFKSAINANEEAIEAYIGAVIAYFMKGEYAQTLQEFKKCNLNLS